MILMVCNFRVQSIKSSTKVADEEKKMKVAWPAAISVFGKWRRNLALNWSDNWESFENTAIFFSYSVDFDK